MRDTIEMAREAGWKDLPTVRLAFAGFDIKRFEALVRADERKIVMSQPLTKEMWQRFEDEIRADEREACAKLCDKDLKEWGSQADVQEVAAAIRARGEAT